ncbi:MULTISPECIES: putative acetyltransferase [Cellulomonas]|uniref:Histone acetyltransferase Rv0428c-like SH3 domain-containing protein n=1 Tax=Cellulomonas gilvus (strain ATCC 13127 / NRRL B-14078) TaxID=593907 RepID=F7ZYW7_CELGA|nr:MULTISPECIES: hypothetical protein [Cellulomonas]AEI11235.1 hypothetical protein Celgi_0716 [Cellulomonas gilvus ATCC 13127]MCR6687917.1 hypothetical protein [Cellulomonas sp.]
MTSPTAPAWRSMPPGERVVVRRRLPDPEPGGPRLTDVLGVVLRVEPVDVVLETTRGHVRVPGEDVVLWKVIPPRSPDRRLHRR